MCGIFGVMAPRDRGRTTTDDTVIALRDRLSHRGPDDAGLWSNPRAAIGHRRLAVLDPTPAGRQPMVGAADPATGDPRYVLAYNGELYNDLDLRADLASMGVRFETSCDTETVLAALIAWGADALPKLRGMFAIAFYDAREHELLLARDPLGVKPLYYASTTVGPPELLFASEPTPILEHPRFTPSPNLAMVSAYLTTIRTVLGDQTMFDGVHAVRPGEAVRIRFDHAPRIESRPFWTGERAHDDGLFETSIDRTRDAVTASLIAHLRADVPTCSLLSGGLDSTILSTLAADHHHLADVETSYVGEEAKARLLDEKQLEKVSDEYGRLSLRLQSAFGLRREEAIKFRPAYADRGDRLVLKPSWTKGGKARSIPIRTEEQREVLKRVWALAGKGSLIPADKTYIQQLRVYTRQLTNAGLSKMHGLRHAYAQSRYLELTGWACPVAGGPARKAMTRSQRDQDSAARLTISRELGHEREAIVSIYIGS